MRLQEFFNALQNMVLVSNDSHTNEQRALRADIDRSGLISKQEFVEFCMEEYGQTVALKFFRDKSHYIRELRARQMLDARFVVGVIRSHESEEGESFLVSSLRDCLKPYVDNAEDYRYLVVMPYAERNLYTIFRNERPDAGSVRSFMKQIGEAVLHLHQQGLVHGDLKMMNIVRINGRMVLTDLDSSALVGSGYMGSKFSSGVIPPEMVYEAKDYEDLQKYKAYVGNRRVDGGEPLFSTYPRRCFVVRSFLGNEEVDHGDDEESKIPEKEPPYQLIIGDPSYDVWSFGILLYNLCCGESMFVVNTDDDIPNGDSIERLYSWSDDDFIAKSKNIEDPSARYLLMRILRSDPWKRPSMQEILNHEYFFVRSRVIVDESTIRFGAESSISEICEKLESDTIEKSVLIQAIELMGDSQDQAPELWKKVIHIYSLEPTMIQALINKAIGEKEKKSKNVKFSYIDTIVACTVTDLVDVSKQHGWVEFLAHHVHQRDSEECKMLVDRLGDATRAIVKVLATAKDKEGRLASHVANFSIRSAFERKLFFLGRYDLASGQPIHKSATCIVIKAHDSKMLEYYENEFDRYHKVEAGGQSDKLSLEVFERALDDMSLVSTDAKIVRQYTAMMDVNQDGFISRGEFVQFCLEEFGHTVALKFMRKKSQYSRERQGRKKLDKRFVVGMLRCHDEESDQSLVSSLREFLMPYLSHADIAEEYRYVVVMPFGDRNLDTIFRSEQPDKLAIRALMKQIGHAVAHLHENGLVHGDLKMLNVVRIHGSMLLIDLDESSPLDGGYMGSKFSSGVVPPEMIYQLAGVHEKEKYLLYIMQENKEGRKKRAPKSSTNFSYVVRSFLEEEKYDESSISQKDELTFYDLIPADTSYDVWSFGVLLYTMCSKEPLFKVNSDDDISNGDAMRSLYNWREQDMETLLDLNISDEAAKALLKRILKKDPTQRPPMEEILKDEFFELETRTGSKQDEKSHEPDMNTKMLMEQLLKTQALILGNRQILQNEFSKIHESLRHVLMYQKAASKLLQEVTKNSKVPKYFVILPAAGSSSTEKGISGFLKKIKKKTDLTTPARLCFVCPISLEPAMDSRGEAIGYDVDVPKEWVREYGPAILVGLKIVQLGMAVGRGFGLPLPSLSGAEEELRATSDFFAQMQGYIVEQMGEDPEEQGLADILLNQCADAIESTASSNIPGMMTENQRRKIKSSYDGIGELIKPEDVEFKRCGLVRTFNTNGTDESEFVHPDFVELYTLKGSSCFGMSMTEIRKEMAKLAAQAPIDTIETTKTIDIPSVASSGATADFMQKPKTCRAGKGDSSRSENVYPVQKTANLVGEQNLLESLNEKVHQMDLTLQRTLQGISKGSTNVVHKGWLRVQSRRSSLLWLERYVVVYEDGRVVWYSQAAAMNDPTVPGSTLPAVRWKQVEGSEVLELLASNPPKQDVLITKARLSKRCSSKVEDWLQGNEWIDRRQASTSPDNLGTKVETPSKTARLDHTGQVIIDASL